MMMVTGTVNVGGEGAATSARADFDPQQQKEVVYVTVNEQPRCDSAHSLETGKMQEVIEEKTESIENFGVYGKVEEQQAGDVVPQQVCAIDKAVCRGECDVLVVTTCVGMNGR